MRELTEIKRTGGMVDALLADHGLFHLEADLRWIDLTAARLGAAGRGGARRMTACRQAADRGPRRRAVLRADARAARGRASSVAAGEILAVMGPSGSGKSTLLHCLAGILVPDAGEVWFDGRRLDTLSETERSALRRDRFGFVFQFGQLVPELTATENVALPLLLAASPRPRRCARRRRLAGPTRTRRARATAAPASCPAGRRSGSRSPAALVARPEVLFADEPTGSLDSLTGEHVMDLLSSVAREHGTTVVLVTHEPESPPTPTARSSRTRTAQGGSSP